MDTWRRIRALLIGVGLGTGLGLLGAWAPVAYAAAAGQQQNQPAASAGRIIRESGVVQPAQYVEIRNQAEQPLAILFIAPQGKAVKKGDLLVELDASALTDKRIQRVARTQKARAELAVAKASLSTAEHGAAAVEIAEKAFQLAQLQLKAFQEGEYPTQLNAAQSELTIANERLVMAQERVDLMKRNVNDRDEPEKARLQEAQPVLMEARARVQMAESKLALLKAFVRVQRTAELELAVAQRQFDLARAKDASSEATVKGEAVVTIAETNYQMASDRLAMVEQQITSCKMYAPRDGTVIYPNDTFSDDAGKAVSRPRPGAIVRNRQVVVRLADTSRLNVEVPVTLQVAQRVTTGLSATIRLDAIPGRTVVGHVSEVRVLLEAPPGASEALITVRIDDPSADLKPGMRATVEFDLSQAPQPQK
jgi:HlyD family secretion protein